MKRIYYIIIIMLAILSIGGIAEAKVCPVLYMQSQKKNVPKKKQTITRTKRDIKKKSHTSVRGKKLSAAYKEGYDKGYEDGEDDAVNGSGYEYQFDDETKYKGQKKKDFQTGYAEGYEAGYDDNMSENHD